MDIHTAAKLLNEKLNGENIDSKPIWSVGVGEPDTIYLYQHRYKRLRPPVDISNGWEGFRVIESWVGEIKMC